MGPLRIRRFARIALFAACLALAALACGCALVGAGGPHATAPVEPLSVAARASQPDTAAAEASASVSASRTGDASASATASHTPAPRAPRVAKLPNPIAGLPPAQPATEITGPRNLGVPVLMYHMIGIAPAGAANPDLYVKPGEFTAQLRYLSKHGYHAVTLQQVYDFWHNGKPLPDKPIVISFDDGNTCHFTIAAPLLKELEWPGVLNLIVGKKHVRLKKQWVRALIAAGWEIDSHTISHHEVPGMSPKQLAFEVGDSRRKLQKMYDIPVNFFCYPSGAFDDAAVAAVKKAGYLGATTTMGGLARPGDAYLLRRVRISGGMSSEAFAAQIKQYK